MTVAGVITAALLAAAWNIDAETDQGAIAELRTLAVRGYADELKAKVAGFEPEILDPLAQHATCAGQPESVKVLLAAGARAKVFGALGMECLLHPQPRAYEKPRLPDAARAAELGRLLVEAGMGVGDLLPSAAGACASDLVQFLIGKGADPNAASPDGRSPLTMAQGCSEELAERLIAAGARVRRDPKAPSTPLHALVQAGPEPAVFERRLKLLISAGAEVNAPDQKGRTPLALASGRTFFEREDRKFDLAHGEAYARSLLAVKADPNLADDDGATPLLRALLDSGQPCAALNTGDYRGWGGLTTPERQDAERVRLEGSCAAQKRLLELLLDAQANGRVESKHGATPLLAAAENGCTDCLVILAKHGISLDTRDADGRTVLHWIAMGRRGVTMGPERRAVKALLDTGATREPKDKAGSTPYVLAGGKLREIGDLLSTPGRPIRAAMKGASASSTLLEKGRAKGFYRPENAFDGKLETCWCEGVPGDGIGEWLQVDFKVPSRVKAVRLYPACTDDPKIADANNQLTAVDVTTGDWTRPVHLLPDRRLQDIGADWAKPVKSIRITLKQVYQEEGWMEPPKPKIPDTCICEVEVDLE